MGEIHVRRIEQKMLETYKDLIDMNDYNKKNEHEKHSAFLSRAIAASSIFLFTGTSYENCANAITDGFDDMGIDAVFNDNEAKILYLVQAKWISDGNGSPDQASILKFINGFRSIVKGIDMNSCRANEKLRKKAPDIDCALMDSDYKIHLLIVYTGSQKLSNNVVNDLDALMISMNDTSDLVAYSSVNQKQLYDVISGGADATPINIDDIDLRDWGRIDSPYLAYYGNMNAAILAKWWEEYGNRLFAKNIRHYKGSSETNEGIMKTLKEVPKDFWYFNNGIKILCESFAKKPLYGDDRSVGLFTARGISIVNGAQTVGCIGAIGKSDLEKLLEAKVMVQFISLENTPENYDVQVTKLSNTQNKIGGRDFAALDPEQERIRRDLWMSGITYFYKGNIEINNDKEISIDEALVSLTCFQTDIKLVTLVKSNIGAFYEDTSKTPYINIFNNKTNTTLLHNTVLVNRYMDKLLRDRQREATGRDRQILVHGNRFILFCVMQFMSLRSRMYSTLGSDDIENDVDNLIDKIIEKLNIGISHYFSESYLNSLFKNNTKCITLCEYINENITLS